jgi:hypothetical protein
LEASQQFSFLEGRVVNSTPNPHPGGPDLLLSYKILMFFINFKLLGTFFFITASRTALGPTQPHIQWVPGALSLGVKRPGREADHSPPSSAEVKESYASTPQYAFMAWCLVRKAQEQLYFYL